MGPGGRETHREERRSACNYPLDEANLEWVGAQPGLLRGGEERRLDAILEEHGHEETSQQRDRGKEITVTNLDSLSA